MPGGRLSHAAMLEWLARHYDTVRATAGLPPVASLDGVSSAARRELQLANTMLTILEFAESRSTRPDEKSQLRIIQRLIERAV